MERFTLWATCPCFGGAQRPKGSCTSSSPERTDAKLESWRARAPVDQCLEIHLTERGFVSRSVDAEQTLPLCDGLDALHSFSIFIQHFGTRQDRHKSQLGLVWGFACQGVSARRRILYGALPVKEFRHAGASLSFISFFVRSESRFFVPTRASPMSARACSALCQAKP
jgi:hypothetical protein